MAKKEEFKEFVRNNPKLLKHIKSGDMTWQKFYEIYDMYGEEESVWKDYTQTEEKVERTAAAAATGAVTGNAIADIVNVFKNIDLDSLQNGIGNIQRVLGVIQDFGKKDTSTEPQKTEYKPRPIYKHFED